MSEPRTSSSNPRSPMAWPLAAATAALLAAAPGLSQATPIVVQPGTTAGYLYFPKATQAEELLKADLQKTKADLAKAQADLLKLSADLEKLRKDSFEWTWDQAPTGNGWSLHRHIGHLHDPANPYGFHTIFSKLAVLEAKPATTYATGGLYGFCAYHVSQHFEGGSCNKQGPIWPILAVGQCAPGFAWVHTTARWDGKTEWWASSCVKQ